MSTMKSAGYDVREDDPFTTKLDVTLSSREVSPYANRIKLMWHNLRQSVIDNFPVKTEIPIDKERYLEQVDHIYITDAYNSLSIEGYRVTEQLIEQVLAATGIQTAITLTRNRKMPWLHGDTGWLFRRSKKASNLCLKERMPGK